MPLNHEIRPDLEDYEILERIGAGGMGIVYRARQLSLNRIVALKMLRVGELASPAVLARFRREAEAAAKLDHPNIVAVYEVGEHEANPFLVMRFIDGVSLAERGTRSEMDVARLATVARAVHYAHERGVLHRDLKPSNILLDHDDNPHLTDFGVAKLLDQEPALTQTSELLGTPSYMAPEQAAGKAISRSADIYSLGAILYELLTGRPPFAGGRPVEILRRVMEEEPLHPSLIKASADRDLGIICLKCLDKDPARRYYSALEFAEDLERWQHREPILARPAGWLLRLRRWTVRNPALAMLIAGLVTGIALTLSLLADAREEKARKSIALAILRTETARQLQEIWASPKPFFAVNSETLAAMAGKEPARLQSGEKRLTIALVAAGNPLDRVLGAAPLLEHLEQSMASSTHTPTRVDLRLYKTEQQAESDLIAGAVDLMQMSGRAYWRAKKQAPELQALVSFVLPSGPGGLRGDSSVIFTRPDAGIRSLSDLRDRSFLFGTADSTLTFWAKVHLVEAGIRSNALSKYRYLDADGESGRNASSPADAPDLGNPFSNMTPVEAVINGSYDAAVATERRFVQVSAKEKLILLTRFEDSAALLVGQSRLPASIAKSLEEAMISLKDRHVLQIFPGNPKSFKAYSETDFSELRDKLALESRFDEDSSTDN